MPIELIIAIALALIFNFLNGVRDAANIVATMISSRAFAPRTALTIAALAEFTGPFLFGVGVARTIGAETVESGALTLTVIIAALLGAIVWNAVNGFFGIPGSSSHTLIGGMVGAAVAAAGWEAIKLKGLTIVLLALFAYPIIGFAVGFAFTRLVYYLVQNATPRINDFFKRSQLATAIILGLSHGTNDAQKSMGIIVLSLVICGALPEFQVPLWVVIASAASIALGTSLGGWRLIRTLGGKFYKIRPIHSFATQMSSGIVILSASFFGAPVSTSHVVSSAIIGVGASERFSKVRWSVAGDILTAWLITIPASAAFAAGFYWLLISLP
ncbi:MAG: inorganic phosphate transporter [Anaerolineales bacterium]|nr:inorganic phosphate transporter [Anaerolineales bacterium]